MDQIQTGAALAYTQAQLGGPCIDVDSAPTANTPAAIMIQGNGDRVGLLIMNLSANTVYVGLDSQVSSTKGLLLAPNGGLVSFNVRDDFTLPSRAWYCNSPSGASQMYVLEIYRALLTASK